MIDPNAHLNATRQIGIGDIQNRRIPLHWKAFRQRTRLSSARMSTVVVCAVTVALLSSTVVAQPAAAAPATPPQPAGAGPLLDPAPAPAIYPNVAVQRDVPVTMSDGTVLRGDIYRPADASGAPVYTPMPTVLAMTPYSKLISAIADAVYSGTPIGDIVDNVTRSIDLSGTPFNGITDLTQSLPGGILQTSIGVNRKLIARGFTQMVVDVRGTGESNGVWEFLGPREQQDTLDVLAWIRQQPWSNGKMGMAGSSYLGINSVQAAAKNPHGLDAIFPMVPSSRPTELLNLGGTASPFVPLWWVAVNALKMAPPFQSIISGHFDPQWFIDRITNIGPRLPEGLEWLFGGQGPLATNSEMLKQRDTDPTQIKTAATMVVGGWHDLFVNTTPEIYNKIPLAPGKKQLVMGDWYHVQPGRGAGPGTPPNMTDLEVAWFDHWLAGVDNGIDRQGPVSLAQQGGTWTTTGQFPRPDTTYRRLYLSADPSGTAGHSVHDGTLSDQPVATPQRTTVSPGIAAVCSRDAAQSSGGALAVLGFLCADSDYVQESNALSFTSNAVDTPTQISGPLNLHMITSTSATEANWAVTLNDVDPNGFSQVLATGAMLSSRRAIDEADSARLPNGDYTDVTHPETAESLLPVLPGQPTTIDLRINATDAVLQPGHRLQVNISAGSLPKHIPVLPTLIATQLAPQTIELDPNQPSFLTLPVVGDAALGITPPPTTDTHQPR